MMTNRLQALSADTHGALRVDGTKLSQVLSTSHLLLLRANEVTRAACDFPVFFTQGSQEARPTLSALCAFETGKNLFVSDTWQASFTPNSIATQPFVLVKADNEKGYAVGIDIEHPTVSDSEGEALYQNGEKLSLFAMDKSRLIESTLNDDAVTYQALDKLRAMSLVADIDMVLEYADGTKQAISGLATVNEETLANLDATQTHELQKSGLMMMLHAMLMSLFQVNKLINKHNAALPDDANSNAIANVKFESARNRHAGDAV